MKKKRIFKTKHICNKVKISYSYLWLYMYMIGGRLSVCHPSICILQYASFLLVRERNDRWYKITIFLYLTCSSFLFVLFQYIHYNFHRVNICSKKKRRNSKSREKKQYMYVIIVHDRMFSSSSLSHIYMDVHRNHLLVHYLSHA